MHKIFTSDHISCTHICFKLNRDKLIVHFILNQFSHFIFDVFSPNEVYQFIKKILRKNYSSPNKGHSERNIERFILICNESGHYLENFRVLIKLKNFLHLDEKKIVLQF